MSEPDIKPTRWRRFRNWIVNRLWGYYIYMIPSWVWGMMATSFLVGALVVVAYTQGRKDQHHAEANAELRRLTKENHARVIEMIADYKALKKECTHYEQSWSECERDMRKNLEAVVGILGCDPSSGIVLKEKDAD